MREARVLPWLEVEELLYLVEVREEEREDVFADLLLSAAINARMTIRAMMIAAASPLPKKKTTRNISHQ
jgi:hypothetical protein